MQRNHRKIYGWLFSFLLLIVVGIAGVYFYSYQLLQTKITAVEANLKEKGYVLSYSGMSLSLNPFDLHMVLKDPSMRDKFGLIEWKGEELNVRLRPWDYYKLRFDFAGPQSLHFLSHTPFPLGVIQLEGLNAYLILTSKGGIEELDISVNKLISEIEKKQQPIYLKSFHLNLGNLSNPLSLHLALQTHFLGVETLITKKPIEKDLVFEFEANLSGYVEKSFPNSLAEWRDGGGVVDVNTLKVSWPPILLESKGTLTLDKEMYPLGSFSTQVVGYKEILDHMVGLGIVKEKNVAAVTFVLDIIGKTDDNGLKKLTIPVTLQNKKLSIGPASLMKLQPVEGL